jgi:hypothetical protein
MSNSLHLEFDGTLIEFEQDPIKTGPAPGSQHNADARQAAVEQWKRGARTSTVANLDKAIDAVQALIIQLRAVGGTSSGTDFAKRMRLAADFMEDI